MQVLTRSQIVNGTGFPAQARFVQIDSTMDTHSIAQDVEAVNYLMREPVTLDEAERVLHALALANYTVTRLPTAERLRVLTTRLKRSK